MAKMEIQLPVEPPSVMAVWINAYRDTPALQNRFATGTANLQRVRTSIAMVREAGEIAIDSSRRGVVLISHGDCDVGVIVLVLVVGVKTNACVCKEWLHLRQSVPPEG